MEAKGREGEVDDSTLGALHTPPLAEVEVFIEGEEEPVVEVSAGIEVERGDNVGGKEGVGGRVGGDSERGRWEEEKEEGEGGSGGYGYRGGGGESGGRGVYHCLVRVKWEFGVMGD
ncbi:hypothetical protein ACJRO7_012038 [Eucalyptus globulus]|uniref:Uncharacterized protein n=1 Tax=Eucalyptus globulus TaxID=34317 RepID=A0ABD3LH90_EUCGL